MAPNKRKAESYDKSDPFVADDDDAGFKPASKRNKAQQSNGKSSKLETKTDDDGNEFWEISKARRVGLSEFKGKNMVSIREYYEKDSKWLPGKKGITMTVEQFTTLISILPQIEASLAKKGESIPRPQYDGAEPVQQQEASDDEEEIDKKANFDATSEEDDD